MFDHSLLDSSPVRMPVLKGKHWAISVLAGVFVFLAGMYLLRVLIPQEAIKLIVTQSATLGILLMCFSLMLCYVGADAQRQGLQVWFWVTVALLLNLIGFLIYLMYSAAKTGDWKRATVPIAYISEVVFVGALVLVPLIYTDALPRGFLIPDVLVAPPSGPAPAPRAPAPAPKPRRHEVVDLMKVQILIPKGVNELNEQPEPPPDLTGSSLLPGLSGVPGGLGPANASNMMAPIITPPPPPASASKPKAPLRIRQGGVVQAAKLIYQPKPEYPPLAKMARIQGSVRLEAVINKDGTIEALKVIDGSPLLVQAAIDAVSRWRYQPTLLNGEPVEVLTEVDVNFRLQE